VGRGLIQTPKAEVPSLAICISLWLHIAPFISCPFNQIHLIMVHCFPVVWDECILEKKHCLTLCGPFMRNIERHCP